MKKPRCILLDIEGTTSSISFVYDVMFPYVRKHLKSFLDQSWDSVAVQDCLPMLAKELGHDSAEDWLGSDSKEGPSMVAQAVIKLMDDDVKATGLKKLQGAIWKNGFESGQMVAHVYDDVEPAIWTWKAAGIDVRIYSSGSVEAQKLFFGHCVAGNLLDQFSGHYDTTIGAKKESESYAAIASDAQLATKDVLFVSDVAAELDAAQNAGMQTLLSIRPGNPEQADSRHASITSFAEIHFEVSA